MSKMKDRVASLLAKANDNASSEAEASVALEMAQKLLVEHGLTLEDVMGHNAEEIGSIRSKWRKGRTGDAMQYVMNAIAAFTNCRVSFQGNSSAGTRQTYYGYDSERQLALWLHDHVACAISAESALYQPNAQTAYCRSRERRHFALGMASRVAARLHAMTETRQEVASETGSELVLVREAALNEFYNDLNLAKDRSRNRCVNATALDAGRRAGDDVSLGRPVEAASGPLMIG